ncbi:M23 family metallopeptidase [Cellulosimicrobium terreum]|nr:M23 family metallopeptidase [Cellulosimicrobium terreum]
MLGDGGVPDDVGPGPGSSTSTSTGWLPPVGRLGDLDVLDPFDPPVQNWLPGHRGVDLAAGASEVVRSPADGVVTFAGPVAGRDVVVVTHDDGLRTSLEPVTADVGRGSRVAAGGVVGVVQSGAGGHTARCTTTCVHWGVRRGETYVDPLGLLGDRPPIVLLPGVPSG